MKKTAAKKRTGARKKAGAKKTPAAKKARAATKRPAAKKAVREKLTAYRHKRDFARTAEPEGGAAQPVPRPLQFVIQKHAASHLHFDLRLELDGVMKSWAVPKGPHYDPKVRRLAMEVEDHPIEYNTFEGIIPKGQYGGGTVMLWDRGTYEAEDGGGAESLRAGYRRGDMKFIMHGERMRGGWVLVRTSGRGERAQWLLIKHRDDEARAGHDVVAEEVTSITTGRTMDEIAARTKRVWQSNRGGDGGGEAERAAPARATSARTTSRKESSAIVAQLEAIEGARGEGTLEFPGGRTLDVTNLGKVFFPKHRLTKGDLMRYYATVAPLILPAVADRPLVLRRFPNGVKGKAFYQQKPGPTTPDGPRVETLDAFGKHEPRFVGGDLLTLLYTVQLGAISVDPWHSRVGSLAFADYTIIDLDPGEKAGFGRVLEVARIVRDALDELGLHAIAKTSGASGIHVVVPLPPRTPNEAATLVAQIVATAVARAHPKLATIERSVRARPARTIYMDYLQNILGKTVAGVYSARATDDATVSTPLDWDEIDAGVHPSDFTIVDAPARFAKRGDLWAKAMRRRNSLEAILADARP